jgi:hypothetical protein
VQASWHSLPGKAVGLELGDRACSCAAHLGLIHSRHFLLRTCSIASAEASGVVSRIPPLCSNPLTKTLVKQRSICTEWLRSLEFCDAPDLPQKSRDPTTIVLTSLLYLAFATITIQAPSQESFPENGGAVAFNGITPMFLALRWKRFSR